MYIRSHEVRERLQNAVIESLDFEEFLDAYPPQATDLLLLDPPYLSSFSTYAQNTFTLQDHARLARYLLARCRAKFLLIIQKAPAILALYQQEGIYIQTFNKTYQVSIKNRNKRGAEHLMITNYE